MAGLGWPLPEGLDDAQLEALLYPPAPQGATEQRPVPDWAVVHRELRRPNVTLALLWEEYRTGAGAQDGFGYSWFCDLYREWGGRLKPTLRQVWGVRHFGVYKLPGAPARFARDDFAALPKILRRWSPAWRPTAEDMAPVRECFTDPASLNAAFGYYRALRFTPEPFQRKRVSVPTVVFSGLGDPNASRIDYERGRRMFEGDYTIEEVPGGHFMHLEHPDVFAERLLKHL